MRPTGPLILNPRACDRCGACLEVCKPGALKVGRTYLKVDTALCDGCGACARACKRKAIVLADKAARSPAPATERAKPARRPSSDTSRAASAPAAATKPAPPRPARPAGRFGWSTAEAGAMLSVTFAAFTIKELLSLAPFAADLSSGMQITVRVGALVLYYVLQVALLVYLVRRKNGDVLGAVGLRRLGKGARHTLSSAILVLAGLVVTRSVAALYTYVTSAAGLMPSSGTELPALFGSNTAGFALAVLMVVVVGPVVEEAVFRAVLLEGLAARFGAWPAIIVQAALFAAFHRSLWLFFPTFVLGLVLGWLAHARESLWPPIVLHALYNGIAVGAVFLVASLG